MQRLATILMIAGVICYLCAPLILSVSSPIDGLVPGDFMLALFALGGLLVFSGVVVRHRLKLQGQRGH